MIDWFEPYSQVLEWNLPHAKWFVGGKLNVSYNCLDRHAEKDPNKPALFWEAEDGATLELTYAELLERVCRFANALSNLGVKAGDCVAIYMPMVPELPICDARLRANWRHPFRYFWRIQRHGAGRSHRGRQVENPDYRRRRLPTRQGGPAQGHRRRRPQELPHHRKLDRRPAHRRKSRLAGRPRSLVARSRRSRLQGLPRRAIRFRAAALHPLHQRHHRQTQGRPAHARQAICCR